MENRAHFQAELLEMSLSAAAQEEALAAIIERSDKAESI